MLMPGRNSEELQQADTVSGASPLHIEAENYLYQSGAIASETCSDAGGGQDLTNIGGSYYAVYSVTVAQAGTYLVKFRVAGSGGTFQFKDSSLNVLATVTVPNTGSGQTWTTITATVVLRAGTQQVHFYCTQPGWNLNWLEFVFRAGDSYSSSFPALGGYRYGFNGKEKSDDIAPNDYNFGARIYDGRIGRWLSLDPLQSKYPAFSAYSFALNNPTLIVDIDGGDIYIVTSNGALRIAKETLLKTPSGKALWNKYASSKTDDIYIAVGTLPKSLSASAGTLYGIENTTLIKKEFYTNKENQVRGKNVIDVDPKNQNTKGFEVFQAVDVTKSDGKKIHLIVVNKNLGFTDDAKKQGEIMKQMQQTPEELKYDNAESIFHEFKSHIDLHGNKNGEHTAYGKAINGVFRTDVLPTKGSPAEKIRDELKILYDEEIKNKEKKEGKNAEPPKKDSVKTSS